MADDFYTYESIQVLKGLEGVRKRPGMYFGDLESGFAMHQMLWEAVENALTEHLDNFASRIELRIDEERVTVEDNGRGIPIDPHPTANISGLEMLLTTLHAGIGWPQRYRPTGGLHGVGIAAVNALASALEARTARDGHAYVQRYDRGVPITAVEYVGPTTCTGTRISFIPDFDVLPRRPWNKNAIAARCRDLAALYPGLTMVVNGDAYRYDDGVADRVREISGWLDPFQVRATRDDIQIDLALAWAQRCRKSLRTFVNANATSKGTHVDALFDMLEAAIAPRLRSKRGLRKRIELGLVGMLHVQLPDPRYKSQLKAEILNPEAGAAVRSVEREFARYLDETPAMLDTLLLQLTSRSAS
jgi:DNA gyrase subunit B